MASKNTFSPFSESKMKTHAYNLSFSSPATNNYGSHAAGIKKAMKILENQFGNPHTSSTTNDNNMMMMVNDTCYHSNLITSSSRSHNMSSQEISVGIDHSKVNNKKNKKIIDDGRIHSLSYKKFGPYTCSKCNQVFVTSQKFASHVTSRHYKFESEQERRKRYMSRIRKRPGLQIQKLNDGTTTFVPVSSSTDHPHVALVNDNVHSQITLPPPTGVRIKSESANN